MCPSCGPLATLHAQFRNHAALTLLCAEPTLNILHGRSQRHFRIRSLGACKKQIEVMDQSRSQDVKAEAITFLLLVHKGGIAVYVAASHSLLAEPERVRAMPKDTCSSGVPPKGPSHAALRRVPPALRTAPSRGLRRQQALPKVRALGQEHGHLQKGEAEVPRNGMATSQTANAVQDRHIHHKPAP